MILHSKVKTLNIHIYQTVHMNCFSFFLILKDDGERKTNISLPDPVMLFELDSTGTEVNGRFPYPLFIPPEISVIYI